MPVIYMFEQCCKSLQYIMSNEDTSQFNEDFIKNYNEESDEGYFPEVDIQYLKNLHELHNDLPFFARKNEN